MITGCQEELLGSMDVTRTGMPGCGATLGAESPLVFGTPAGAIVPIMVGEGDSGQVVLPKYMAVGQGKHSVDVH